MNKCLRWLFPFSCLFLLAGCGLTDVVGSFFSEVLGYIGAIVVIFGAWYIFWPLMCILFLWISYMIDDHDLTGNRDDCYYEQHPVKVAIAFLAFLGMIQLVGKIDIIAFATSGFLNFIMSVGGYFGIGLIWSVAKVYMTGRDRARKFFEERKQNFLKENNNDEQAWYAHISEINYKHQKLDMSTGDLPKKIWLVYWPFSMFWFFFHDFVRRFVDFLVEIFKNVYVYVYGKAMGNVLAEYRVAEEMNREKQKQQHEEVADRYIVD